MFLSVRLGYLLHFTLAAGGRGHSLSERNQIKARKAPRREGGQYFYLWDEIFLFLFVCGDGRFCRSVTERAACNVPVTRLIYNAGGAEWCCLLRQAELRSESIEMEQSPWSQWRRSSITGRLLHADAFKHYLNLWELFRSDFILHRGWESAELQHEDNRKRLQGNSRSC